jgi:hypothetical protein
MELLQLVNVHVEEASRPLREEVANLKLLLAHVAGSLEHTPGESVEQESYVVEEECSFGCFSPHARPCTGPHCDVPVAYESEDTDEIMTPVMEIMPELQELCGKPSPSMSMVELGSLESVAVAMTSLPPASAEPNFVDTGGVLAPNSKALFRKELCDLLVSLEAANLGYGKDIACVLMGKASKGLIRKVKKYLRSRRKNIIITITLPQLLESSYFASGDPNIVS